MIRLPLFENGEYFFCLNFWSDDYDAFTWTHVEQLQRLVRPLAGELRERLSFTEEKALSYTPAGSGFERLSLCPGAGRGPAAHRAGGPDADDGAYPWGNGVGQGVRGRRHP